MVEISIDSESLEFRNSIVLRIVMTDPFIIIQSNSTSILQGSRKLIAPLGIGILSFSLVVLRRAKAACLIFFTALSSSSRTVCCRGM